MQWQEKITQGRAARGQGPDRQRRGRDQRSRPAAALRGLGEREDPEERRQSVRGLVLRAASAAPAGVDGGGHGRDRGQGAGIPPAPLRGLLPVPPGDALGLPAEVAGASAVPADARHAGDAGAVDFHRRSGRLSARRGPSRSSRSARRRSRSPGSAAWSSASSGSRGSSPRSTPTSLASSRIARRSTPTPRDRCVTSTAASARRSSSSRRVGRPTRSPICPSCASPSASRSWTRRRSTTPPSRWRTGPTSSARWARTASGSVTSRP